MCPDLGLRSCHIVLKVYGSLEVLCYHYGCGRFSFLHHEPPMADVLF